MRILLPLAFAVLLAASPASCQAPSVPPTLELTAASTLDGGPVAIDPGASTLVVPWVYRFSNPGSEAATFGDGEVTLAWSMDCGNAGLTLVDPPVTSIAFVPNQGEYRGTAELPVTASPDTPGQVSLPCTLVAQASATTEGMAASGTLDFGLMAAFRGEIRVSTPQASQGSGPQKMIRYEVVVENLGNAPTLVTFEPVGDLPGKWQELMPDPLLLDTGETDSVLLNVATPFHNGYVRDATDVVLRATPTSQYDRGLTGPPQEITFRATAQGWYVPGASPLLVVAVLAAAALVMRPRQP